MVRRAYGQLYSYNKIEKGLSQILSKYWRFSKVLLKPKGGLPLLDHLENDHEIQITDE